MTKENSILKDNNVLVVLGHAENTGDALRYVIDHFCGAVVYTTSALEAIAPGAHVYVCGDLGSWPEGLTRCRVIKDLSTSTDRIPQADEVEMIDVGRVPLIVHDVGVLYRRFFDQDDLFQRIQAEHEFQELTESTKASKALRTGIYLTDIAQECDEDGEVLHFRLLRCSSNLTGPTDNFRQTDRMVMSAINEAASEVFAQETDLNHVLAQIYENKKETGERPKERKAKISAHSDKTKDMREDGLIAFCTFYDPQGFTHLKPSEHDPFDWCYKKTSGLTRLHFKLKPTVEDASLTKEFSVTLYPNSVFIIPLSTNRLYTHEIRPSLLNVDRIPTRMGYVARCSKAEAQFMGGQTYLKEGGALIPLEPMSREALSELRQDYYKENRTDDEVAYGKVHFSMNTGDYQRPLY